MAKKKKKEKDIPAVEGPGGVKIVKTAASFDFLKTCQIWVGGPGTGKTSTGAALGDASRALGIPDIDPFFLWFEAGSTEVPVAGSSQPCPDCNGKNSNKCNRCDGTGIIPLILGAIAGKDPMSQINEWFEWAAASEFNPIFVDVGNAYYLQVVEAICHQNNVPSPNMAEDHGATWTQIFDAVRLGHATLTESGKAVIYLMHSYERVKRIRGGGEIVEQVCHISGASNNFLKGAATQILHFDIVPTLDDDDPDKAVIHCNPYAGIEAKDRWGMLPDEIDRGTSPEEGASALLKCFYDV